VTICDAVFRKFQFTGTLFHFALGYDPYPLDLSWSDYIENITMDPGKLLKTMLGSSLPAAICRRTHALFTSVDVCEVSLGLFFSQMIHCPPSLCDYL
jgi:hypothetical protein